MSEVTMALSRQVKALQSQLRALENRLDQAPERVADHGRDRFLMWGQLDEELAAGGVADVTLKKQDDEGEWQTVGVLEDVQAPPTMPDGTCILATTGTPPHATWVCVGWFPLDDDQYYVVGAEICPTTDCSSGSSSS